MRKLTHKSRLSTRNISSDIFASASQDDYEAILRMMKEKNHETNEEKKQREIKESLGIF